MKNPNRTGRGWHCGATLLVLLLSSVCAYAGGHKSESWARSRFEAAQHMREALTSKPALERTRRDYQRVISAYRQVYFGAPVSTKSAAGAAGTAELLAEMGRQFDDEKALQAAVRQYEFLRREYPGCPQRFEALYAIAEIYKDDLEDSKQAKQAFEEFLHSYPRHHLADDARQELADLSQPASPKTVASESGKTPDKPSEDKESADAPNVAADDAPTSGDDNNPSRTQVTGIRHWSTPDYTRVAIELERNVKYESQRIENPDRVYFDLAATHLAPALAGKNFDVNDGFVKQIRVAQYRPGQTRIVLDVDGQSDYHSFVLADPPRLVIDVYGKQKAANGKPSATKKIIVAPDEDETAATDPPPATVKPAAGPVSSGPAARGRRGSKPLTPREVREAKPTASGDRSLIRALGLKIGKIVIDPGHGGYDTGTIGPKGLLEKDLVLDVSRRLGKLLSKLGADVVFTRSDDTFIPLETRTAIANQEQADLFVSVHANSSSDPDARGVETYYLNFTSSMDALEVAARENAVSDKSIHELQDLVKKIALKEKIEESREFASDVQQSLHSGLASRSASIRDRGVKKAPFIVLIGANMPSILAEISFVSNPTDERRLKTPEYRQRIAESLYRGISKYVGGLSGVKVASKVEKDVNQ